MSDRRLHPGPAASWAGEARAMALLAWPLILANLAQIGINTVGMLMVGGLGPDALAAATLAIALFNTVFMVGVGLATAAAPIVAQLVGRDPLATSGALRRTIQQGCWLCVFYALPAWAVLWQAEPILRALGQAPDLAANAARYLHNLQWGLLPALIYIVLRALVSSYGRPAAATVVTVLAILINALLAWLLIFGHAGAPKLGLGGAGLAGAIADLFLAGALLGYALIDRRFRPLRLLNGWWRLDRALLVQLTRLGLPIGITLGFEVTCFAAAGVLIGILGTQPLAAHAIAIQIASICFMVPLGIGQAATIRVGMAAGRGDRIGVGRAGWTALAMGTSFMSGTALVLLLIPEPLIALFLDPHGADTALVTRLAIDLVAVAGLFQIVDGAQTIGAGALRGLKDARVPMLFAGFGYWVAGIPVGALLAFRAGLGGVGIWIGLASGLGCVALLVVVRWHRREALGLGTGAQAIAGS